MDLHLFRVVRSKTGSKDSLDSYADYVEDIVSGLGYDVKDMEVEMSLRSGYLGYLRKGLLAPLIRTLRAGRRDVVHYTFEGLALFIPFCRAKKVVTFHHYVYKEENNPRRWYLLWRMSAGLAVRYADVLITVSEQTKEEVIRELGADPSRIVVFSSSPNRELRLDPSIGKRRMVGCMGSLTERKNISATIRAFAILCSEPGFEDYVLRICGKGPLKDRLVAEAESLGVEDRVEFVSDLSVSELREMYNSCSMVFNTSSHEGVGFLTIEAQACGTPVLYLKGASIPESVTVAAIPCDDEEDMARTAVRLLSDPVRYEEVVRSGLEFSKAYSENCSRSTVELFRGLQDEPLSPKTAE